MKRRLIIAAILAVLLTGCVTFPSPETVMQYCEREVATIETRGHSTDRRHLNAMYARCVDNARAYEVASRTTQSSRVEDRDEGRFTARNGDDAVFIVAREIASPYEYERRSLIRRETKRWFPITAITIESGIRVSQ